jgi:hypothetical protein
VTFGGTTLNSTAMNLPAGGVVAWSAQPVSLMFTANARIRIDPVPEPASIASLGIGVAGLVGLRRRRSRIAA